MIARCIHPDPFVFRLNGGRFDGRWLLCCRTCHVAWTVDPTDDARGAVELALTQDDAEDQLRLILTKAVEA